MNRSAELQGLWGAWSQPRNGAQRTAEGCLGGEGLPSRRAWGGRAGGRPAACPGAWPGARPAPALCWFPSWGWPAQLCQVLIAHWPASDKVWVRPWAERAGAGSYLKSHRGGRVWLAAERPLSMPPSQERGILCKPGLSPREGFPEGRERPRAGGAGAAHPAPGLGLASPRALTCLPLSQGHEAGCSQAVWPPCKLSSAIAGAAAPRGQTGQEEANTVPWVGLCRNISGGYGPDPVTPSDSWAPCQVPAS